MAIVDCGFPAEFPATRPDGSTFIQTGRDALRIFGPTVTVEVGFEASMFAQDANMTSVAQALVSGSAQSGILRTVPALIDTGAVDSCIDEDLANELGLPLVDRQTSSGVGGAHELNLYLGHIRIPALAQINWGRFIGAKLAAGGQPHRALSGRGQLNGMILIYDGRTGAVTLSV
jgi:hypothetical protein